MFNAVKEINTSKVKRKKRRGKEEEWNSFFLFYIHVPSHDALLLLAHAALRLRLLSQAASG